MGNQHDELRFPKRIRDQAQAAPTVPGRTTLAAQLPATSANNGSLYPNSGPFAQFAKNIDPPEPFRTGEAVDHQVGDGTLLDEAQRSRLLPYFVGRVDAALTAYLAALEQLRVTELLRKEPEQSTWLLELFLDVIGQMALGAVTRAVRTFRAGQTVGVENVGDLSAERVASAGRSVSDDHLKGIVRTVIGASKKTMVAAAKPKADPLHPASNTAKAANLSLIEHLQERATVEYQTFREGLLPGTSDAQALVLYASFDARYGHSVGSYVQALQEKLARFQSSGLQKLGVTRNDDARMTGFGTGIETYWQVETKARWVKTPLGKRLALYKRGYQPIPDTVFTGTADRDATAAEKGAFAKRDAAERPLMFVGYVPTEFTAAAIAMHTQKWGAAPEEVQPGPHEILQMGSHE